MIYGWIFLDKTTVGLVFGYLINLIYLIILFFRKEFLGIYMYP